GARLRGHRRRTRARPGGGGRAGPPGRRRGGRRAVGVRPRHPADPAADRRRGGRVHGPGTRPVGRPRAPGGAARAARGWLIAPGASGPSPGGPGKGGRETGGPGAGGRGTGGPGAGGPSTERRWRVTPDELLKQLYDDTLVGNGPAVLELTNTGLGMGMGPETLLYDALIPALEEVGARFERG